MGRRILDAAAHGEQPVNYVSEDSQVYDVPPSETPVAPRYDGDDYHLEEAALERDYKPSPPKCYPHTITKYKTVYKDRKANVYNKVEIRNPRPQVHKTKEIRHTTIRYPVFITQVLKPLLTQVETKVKPLFFTKTLKRIKTIVFTVTGIGQVTVTSVKYEKEYVTRCQKGYGHGGGHKGQGGYHRRDDNGPEPDYTDTEYPARDSRTGYSYEDVLMGTNRGPNPRLPHLGRNRRSVHLDSSLNDVVIAGDTSVTVTNPLPDSHTPT